MYANKILVAILVLAVTIAAGAQELNKTGPTPAAAMTIGQLSDQARQKRIAEESMKNAPQMVSSGQVTPPAGMTIVPSSQILAGTPLEQSTAEKAKKSAPAPKPEPQAEFVPTILAVYKVAKTHYVELQDVNGVARFEAGGVTQSGWSVIHISMSGVELGKPDLKTGTMRKMNVKVSAG